MLDDVYSDLVFPPTVTVGQLHERLGLYLKERPETRDLRIIVMGECPMAITGQIDLSEKDLAVLGTETDSRFWKC